MSSVIIDMFGFRTTILYFVLIFVSLFPLSYILLSYLNTFYYAITFFFSCIFDYVALCVVCLFF